MSDDDALTEADHRYMRLLGDVIRQCRKRKGWTRKDLQAALRATTHGAVDISLQTLATYELGSRQVSAVRLNHLALALCTRASVLLTETDDRMFALVDVFVIDLDQLATSGRVEIAPAIRWAAVLRDQLDHHSRPHHPMTVAALEELAHLCGLDVLHMVAVLSEYRIGQRCEIQ